MEIEIAISEVSPRDKVGKIKQIIHNPKSVLRMPLSRRGLLT